MWAFLLATVSAATFSLFGPVPGNAGPAITLLLIWGAAIWILPRPTGGPRAVFLAALAVRAILLTAEPELSDDIFRYIWEGRVVEMGGNPYLHPPASTHYLEDFAFDPQRLSVNHPEVPSIYPPIALYLFAFFAAIQPEPLFFRAMAGLADAALAATLALILQGRGRKIDNAWLYALFPLMAVETAGSGHLEPFAILPAALAIRAWDRGEPALVWAGLGAQVKLLPGVLFLGLARRAPLQALGIVAVGALSLSPFLDNPSALVAGFGTYTRHWSFNGGLFPLFESLLGPNARPVLILLGGLWVARALTTHRDPLRWWAATGAAFVLLSPTVHPWYVAWAWVPALLLGGRGFTLLAYLVPVSYIVLNTVDPVSGRWTEGMWTRYLQWVPVLALLATEQIRDRFGPGAILPSIRVGPGGPGHAATHGAPP
jgi:hypothetical protein